MRRVKKLFMPFVIVVVLFSSCSTMDKSCVGIESSVSMQKSVQMKYSRLGVQKKHEFFLKKQEKSYKRALRAGDGRYNY